MEVTQRGGAEIDNLFVTAKKLDDSVITDNGLKSLEECGDTLLFSCEMKKGKKRLHGANFAEIDFAQCVTGGGRSRCIRKFPR